MIHIQSISDSWKQRGPPLPQNYFEPRQKSTEYPETGFVTDSTNITIFRNNQESSLLNTIASTPPELHRKMLNKKLLPRVRRLFPNRSPSSSSLAHEVTDVLLKNSPCDIVRMLFCNNVFNIQVRNAIIDIQSKLRSKKIQRIATRITCPNNPVIIDQSPCPSWFEPPIIQGKSRSRERTHTYRYNYRMEDLQQLSSGHYKIPVILTVNK